jgi:hypothetical protein
MEDLCFEPPFSPAMPKAPELGHTIMDVGPNGTRTVNTDSKFLLLGYSVQKIVIGLVISPRGDGAFIRTGFFIGWCSTGPSWSTEEVKQEIITLV